VAVPLGVFASGSGPASISKRGGRAAALRPNARASAGDTGFEALLEQTIKESVRDLLGESSMLAIMYHLKMDNPAKDPALFHERLYQLLRAPALVVEEMIIKDLFRKLDVQYIPKGEFEFVRYSNAARQAYASKEKKRVG
jgi:hypothetical protein